MYSGYTYGGGWKREEGGGKRGEGRGGFGEGSFAQLSLGELGVR